MLRGLSPEVGNNFKGFKPTTVNMAILTLAKEAWFVETDENDVEGFGIPRSRIDR